MAKSSDKARDNFSPNIVEILKKRAAFICSNPSCKAMTIAPSVVDENKVQYIGIAAHITAASKGGPRYDENISEKERKDISNAIFLCNNCATLIDKNGGLDYSKEVLCEWKSKHEKWVVGNLQKSAHKQQNSNVKTSSKNQTGGITATVVNIQGSYSKTLDDRKEHDKGIFLKSDEIFNEDDLNNIMQSLLADESIWSANQDKLERFKYFFEKSSNNYLQDEVEHSKEILLDSLRKVLLFLMYNFDMYPRDQKITDGYKVCMRPELNIDRQGIGTSKQNAEHNKLYKQLNGVVLSFEKAFILYRKTVKEKLHV